MHGDDAMIVDYSSNNSGGNWWLKDAVRACSAFSEAHAELLSKAGGYAQNGADFWYSRNGHGVGFWDRGYPDEVRDGLHAAAKACGEHDLMAEDFGLATA